MLRGRCAAFCCSTLSEADGWGCVRPRNKWSAPVGGRIRRGLPPCVWGWHHASVCIEKCATLTSLPSLCFLGVSAILGWWFSSFWAVGSPLTGFEVTSAHIIEVSGCSATERMARTKTHMLLRCTVDINCRLCLHQSQWTLLTCSLNFVPPTRMSPCCFGRCVCFNLAFIRTGVETLGRWE